MTSALATAVPSSIDSGQWAEEKGSPRRGQDPAGRRFDIQDEETRMVSRGSGLNPTYSRAGSHSLNLWSCIFGIQNPAA